MNEKQKMLETYLVKIAENLDISPTMREKAESSYLAVGKWLCESEECNKVKIIPQGSFYLGIVIRSVTDEDEYDIDLICLLENLKFNSEYEIKNIVGKRLKEHSKYKSMLQLEGKRCWTLEYDEFHMDILPCVPKYNYYIEPLLTEVKLTHKLEDGNYFPKYSNPYKYHEWFEGRMKLQLNEAKNEYSIRNKVEISEIPLYKVKTPLQRAIQLLKRHRDIIYDRLPQSRKDNAPISIIITTLAAYPYNNELSVYETLNNILINMEKYIEIRNGKYYIINPVLSDENFADKWNETPKKAEEFYYWIQTAKYDIIDEPISVLGLHNVSEKLEYCFGKNLVKRSFSKVADTMKEARENKTLYVNSLTEGLATISNNNSKKVEGHTFFGK